jgi:GTP-binding protein
MQIKSAEFETSAASLAGAPALERPEFAFIGRSNVGKSSLLNLLTARSNLARVSDLPGKTRLMNFYAVNHRWRLVDLPGYGYAKVSKNDRADFNEAAADYIRKRKTLRLVFLLIDSRHEPHPVDLDFLEWLIEAGVPFAVVFTKIDKQSATQTQASVARFQQIALAGLDPATEIFLCSSKTKAGRSEILRYIEGRLTGDRAKQPNS